MKSKILLSALFLINQFSALAQLKKAEMNGVQIHYRDTGTGEPVVFVHGAVEDYRTWEPQLGAFSKNYRVISYSRRYNHPNNNTAILKNFSAETEAKDLYDLVKTLRLGRFHLVGHSFGGLTALLFAQKHPTLLLSLTLSEPAIISWIPTTSKLYTDLYDKTLKPVRYSFDRRDTISILRTMLIYFAGEDILNQLPTEAVDALKQNLSEWKAIAFSTNAFTPVSKRSVAALRMPVLFVFARRTMPVLDVVNKELERVLPNAKKLLLEEATHDLWMTHPNEAGQGVLKFLNTLKSGK